MSKHPVAMSEIADISIAVAELADAIKRGGEPDSDRGRRYTVAEVGAVLAAFSRVAASVALGFAVRR